MKVMYDRYLAGCVIRFKTNKKKKEKIPTAESSQKIITEQAFGISLLKKRLSYSRVSFLL